MVRICRLFRQAISLVLPAAILAVGLQSLAPADASERRMRIYSVNTGERIDVIYKRDGEYVPSALKKIDWITRDWRRDEQTRMSRDLIDLLWEVHKQVGSKKPIHLISGFRSRKTNNMLRRTKGGQARKSQHILGKAVDVHFPDVPVKRLRNAGLIRQHGGVGYYPTSSIPFVHLDVGRVRHWPRLPRRELALLFPSGKTKHVPRDGRALRKKDVKIALAKLEKAGKALPWATRRQLQSAPRPVLASLGPVTSGFGIVPDDDSEASHTETPATADGPDADKPATKRTTVSPTTVASAPEYDDDHANELYYQPFPLVPMIADRSVASMDFGAQTDGILKKVHMFFADASASLTQGFEPGLQYGELYWASRFSGRAVSRLLTEARRNGEERGRDARPRVARR
jgi:uncharacterized protein YcbK (DUF882 family)